MYFGTNRGSVAPDAFETHLDISRMGLGRKRPCRLGPLISEAQPTHLFNAVTESEENSPSPLW